mmetsp:Transcript_34192/g.94126  ORF Transcript_34192/g.94126 Transcript_34192/m.94126 type:complete len:815 (-) Transcript_34192:186-2630(-)
MDEPVRRRHLVEDRGELRLLPHEQVFGLCADARRHLLRLARRVWDRGQLELAFERRVGVAQHERGGRRALLGGGGLALEQQLQHGERGRVAERVTDAERLPARHRQCAERDEVELRVCDDAERCAWRQVVRQRVQQHRAERLKLRVHLDLAALGHRRTRRLQVLAVLLDRLVGPRVAAHRLAVRRDRHLDVQVAHKLVDAAAVLRGEARLDGVRLAVGGEHPRDAHALGRRRGAVGGEAHGRLVEQHEVDDRPLAVGKDAAREGARLCGLECHGRGAQRGRRLLRGDRLVRCRDQVGRAHREQLAHRRRAAFLRGEQRAHARLVGVGAREQCAHEQHVRVRVVVEELHAVDVVAHDHFVHLAPLHQVVAHLVRKRAPAVGRLAQFRLGFVRAPLRQPHLADAREAVAARHLVANLVGQLERAAVRLGRPLEGGLDEKLHAAQVHARAALDERVLVLLGEVDDVLELHLHLGVLLRRLVHLGEVLVDGDTSRGILELGRQRERLLEQLQPLLTLAHLHVREANVALHTRKDGRLRLDERERGLHSLDGHLPFARLGIELAQKVVCVHAALALLHLLVEQASLLHPEHGPIDLAVLVSDPAKRLEHLALLLRVVDRLREHQRVLVQLRRLVELLHLAQARAHVLQRADLAGGVARVVVALRQEVELLAGLVEIARLVQILRLALQRLLQGVRLLLNLERWRRERAGVAGLDGGLFGRATFGATPLLLTAAERVGALRVLLLRSGHLLLLFLVVPVTSDKATSATYVGVSRPRRVATVLARLREGVAGAARRSVRDEPRHPTASSSPQPDGGAFCAA